MPRSDDQLIQVHVYSSHRVRSYGLLQYKFGNCEPDFLSTGSGNTSFLVINQRYDYTFGLFSGGKDNVSLAFLCRRSAMS
jgi:hypothetical protein